MLYWGASTRIVRIKPDTLSLHPKRTGCAVLLHHVCMIHAQKRAHAVLSAKSHRAARQHCAHKHVALLCIYETGTLTRMRVCACVCMLVVVLARTRESIVGNHIRTFGRDDTQPHSHTYTHTEAHTCPRQAFVLRY